MKKVGLLLATIYLALFSLVAFAQSLPGSIDGQVDWATLIGQLIANPKAATAAFIGALVVLVFVQGMKSEVLGKFFKFIPDQAQFLVITLLGQAYAVLVHVFVLKDQQASTILIGFLSSGGAAAIFNGIKLAFPKLFKKESVEAQFSQIKE